MFCPTYYWILMWHQSTLALMDKIQNLPPKGSRGENFGVSEKNLCQLLKIFTRLYWDYGIFRTAHPSCQHKRAKTIWDWIFMHTGRYPGDLELTASGLATKWPSEKNSNWYFQPYLLNLVQSTVNKLPVDQVIWYFHGDTCRVCCCAAVFTCTLRIFGDISSVQTADINVPSLRCCQSCTVIDVSGQWRDSVLSRCSSDFPDFWWFDNHQKSV